MAEAVARRVKVKRAARVVFMVGFGCFYWMDKNNIVACAFY